MRISEPTSPFTSRSFTKNFYSLYIFFLAPALSSGFPLSLLSVGEEKGVFFCFVLYIGARAKSRTFGYPFVFLLYFGNIFKWVFFYGGQKIEEVEGQGKIFTAIWLLVDIGTFFICIFLFPFFFSSVAGTNYSQLNPSCKEMSYMTVDR